MYQFTPFVIPIVLSIVTAELRPDPRYPSICIVGGGITGLSIANRLMYRYGHQVVLFEKSADHIGGKLDTFKSWENVWEKGPVLFSSGEPAINAYIDDLKLQRIHWDGQDVAYFNPYTAETETIPTEKLETMRTELTPLVGKYIALRSSYPEWVFESRGYEHVHLLLNSHPDLFLSTHDWLERHKLKGLELVFSIVFTCEGYGHLEDLPILYTLRLLGPKVIQSLGTLILGGEGFKNENIFTIKDGFRELAYRLSTRLPLVFMGHRLVRVHRQEFPEWKNVTLTFRVTKLGVRRQINWCSKVVLAFPPLLHKLTVLINDFSLKEKRLFGKVKVNKYFSSGHILKEPEGNKHVYLGLKDFLNDSTAEKGSWEDGDGRPIALVNSGKGNKGAYTIYSWLYGRYDSGPTAADLGYVDDFLREFLTEFNDVPPRLSFLEGYEYFPHVTGADFAAGFFKDLAELQGKNGVYFATTAASFESVNTAIENAEAMADLIHFT